tara:strand:+ start:764 stop:1072 length:309 start_codon:yes stop_codon:yes gene_type:complete
MELNKAINTLEIHNRWRRGDGKEPMLNPKEIGNSIDLVVGYFKTNNMKDKVKLLKIRLERENKQRNEDMNSVYGVRSGKNNLIHKYNNTKMFIDQLEELLKD